MQILQQKRHAFERTIGQAACDLGAGGVVMFKDNGVEFGV